MIEIDGSAGEGGGQIIRTSLTLSLATLEPFHIVNIRAGRAKPGLLNQHLVAVQAAAEVGQARVEGASLGSRELTFVPRGVKPGDYHFAIGTAGSTTLVVQTLLPILVTASGGSTLVLEGGTHNPFAPPFDFLEKTFVPLLNRMGPRMTVRLDRPGFFPHGGGKIRILVEPSPTLTRLDLCERGPIRGIRVRALIANLARHIAERELKVVARELGLKKDCLEVSEETRSSGPGNVLSIEIESANLTEVITAFGEKGVPAEAVARRAAGEAAEYLASGVPVGAHLADQLLVPLALGAGGSYVTLEPTSHATTNMEVIRTFLGTSISATPSASDQFRFEVAPRESRRTN